MDTSILVLQPTFNSAAESIALFTALTPIGSEHPQIVRYGAAYLAGLETRHARIIVEEGAPILLDLSESGATLWNGEPAGNGPVTLAEGDLLRFGEQLEFRIERSQPVDSEATRLLTQPKPGLQLLLTPQSDRGPEAPIAVTEFPFLVSKTDGHFATYQAAFPEPVSYLSRRHAHVYLSDGALWLEDLGSTNGTQHNGERLTDQAVMLSDGDDVRFGHKYLRFAVTLIEEAASDEETQRALPDGTVMISSAGSFLDVYCDDAAQGAAVDSIVTGAGLAAAEQAQIKGRVDAAALWRGARLRWQQWPYLRLRQIAVLLLLPMLIGALTLTVILRDERPTEVQRLLDEGQPQEALTIAADYATAFPDEPQASQLLDTAFEKAVLPAWIDRMQAGQPADAQAYLADQLQVAPTMAATRTVALLRWMAELALFLGQSDGEVAASVADDNATLQELASHWRTHADHYTRLLRRFTDAYPQLEPVHTQAMSSVRALQGEGADQLQAVAQLQSGITERIAQGQLEDARALSARFGVDYPNLRDMDRFAGDLETLAAIGAARTQKDLGRFLAATEDLTFATEFFGRLRPDIDAERRQALNAQQRLTQAKSQWQQGQLQQAVQTLTVADLDQWNALIATRRMRYENLQEGFTELRSQVGTSHYPDVVIHFYAGLDASEDLFLHEALADDFANQRDRAVANAREQAEEGAQLWTAYYQTFQGIGGGLRLEATVSDAYRELAGQLTQSALVLRRAHRLFALLDMEIPQTLAQPYQKVIEEVARQRSALASLRSVLGNAVVDEKLALLPDEEDRL